MSLGTVALLATLMGSLAAACHQPSQPPVQPPQPANPANGRVSLTLVAGETDGSILPDAGPVPPGDAGVGLFDAAPVRPP